MSEREQIIQLLKDPTQTPKDIATKVGCTTTYVQRIRKELGLSPKDKTQTQPSTEKPTTAPSKADVTFKFQPAAPTPTTETKPQAIATEFKTTVEAGAFTGEELAALFKSINNVLTKEYAPDDSSANLLGKVWSRPINRWLKQDVGNWDILIAAVCTLIIYVPAIAKIVQKKLREKKETQEKRTQTKSNTEET